MGKIKGKEVIGTLCARMYIKNANQDNDFYIIKAKEKSDMNPKDKVSIIQKAIGDGKDVLGVISLSEALLRIVADGVMSLEEAIVTLGELRTDLEKGSKVMETKDMGERGSMKDSAKGISGMDNNQEESIVAEDKMEGAGEDEGEEVCVVRRLTPTETARLQGFPDDYTKIDGADTADAPQFKSHGNSWATPCANFVSTRMEMELRRLGYEGTIRYATCCSGIEAQSVAVRNLDWESMFFSEIETFPCRVLAKHYPNVPNLGDLTQIHYDVEKGVITNEPMPGYELPKEYWKVPICSIPYKIGELEIFSGGTPCQDVSVAGKRRGMSENSGSRSSLAFHYQRIIDELNPVFSLWENVPGAFSSNGGADFIWFVNRCAESGYAMAWRVLDAQYTMTEEFPRAVPQRRRRIWLVGYRGNDWRVPARILFEPERELTDNPPVRIPGIGFQSINPEADVDALREIHNSKDIPEATDGLLDLFAMAEDEAPKVKKVSKMISLEDMPEETDFAKLPMVSIYEFAKRVGEPGYLGDVFRKDKKTACSLLTSEERKALSQGEKDIVEKFETLKAQEDAGELQWEGAEKISPQILENIGNSGILSNGRILTMNCHEWTSGIQLSPTTYSAWEEVMRHKDWLKANELLPDAYDETVCGLSDVLEENPDEKYNLSWRACFGILRRAETRGKELPKPLYIALISTIRENAGIVKWVALNGKETKKKETDLSEKESAMQCFERFISQVVNFDDVTPLQPKRKNECESDIEEDDGEGEDYEVDEDGNPILPESEFVESNETKQKIIHTSSVNGKTVEISEEEVPVMVPVTKVPDFPNGCMNEAGGATAPTIVASQYKGPGNTQDATVVAIKKEG